MQARLCVLLCIFSASLCNGETARVLPPGKLPADKRLGPLNDLHGYFPFKPCATPEAWAERAAQLQRQMRVSLGLYPMPTRTPANPQVFGTVDRDGYTVDKVILESFPGHYVTGNLYRPKNANGRRPAVLCPHGHWPNGRFYDAGEKDIRESIVVGAERFEFSGRFPVQSRCVQLARMGCIVFHYDMIGFADSVQLGHYMGLREAMNTPQRWGLYSPQAEARLQSLMGMQTYNSICALDWLAGRDDVDPSRIGVTGCSGGGTQTFILCALDPRPAVAFPAVMVSTAMQGGCTCENASYLRIGTGNVEFAALIAPRPLGMTAADDWTKEIATKGLPELQTHYKMLGAEGNVMAKPLLQFPHNYNYVSREVMYHFMNKHLKLGLPEPIVEEDYQPLSIAEMSVWDDAHPKPPSGDDYERSLLEWINADQQRQLAEMIPKDEPSLARYREFFGGAMDVMIGRRAPDAGAIQADVRQTIDADNYRLSKLLLRYAAQGEEVPAVVLEPKNWNGQAVVWIHKQGKRSLFDAEGNLRESVRKMIESGMAVIGLDLIGQGEFTPDGVPVQKSRMNVNKESQDHWKKFAGYTFGYNYSLFAQRIHDILSAISFAKHSLGAKKVHLAGFEGAGHWAVAARAMAGDAADRTAADTAGFRFANLTAFDDPDFLPGGAKYLDLPGMAALCTPGALWLAGEPVDESPEVIAAAYRVANKTDALKKFDGAADEAESAGTAWLLAPDAGP